MKTTQDIVEEFNRRFSRKHGNGFHAFARDGKKSSNCGVCAEDRKFNPKGYYLTYLSESKCYWNSEMMKDVEDFIVNILTSYKEELIKEIESKSKMKDGEFGFCKHCKLHKGDYEHDFGTCSSYDSALQDIINLIKNK